MKLDINELRVRAAKFSTDWQKAKNENRETQSFYNDFFKIFDLTRRDVADFEVDVQIGKSKKGRMDLFWPKVLLVEQKSAGLDLDKAEEQADKYYGALPENEKPLYRLVCDFQNFRLFDYTKPDEEDIRFPLAELKENIQHFEFISDITFKAYQKQELINIKASERMGWIHDALFKSGYKGKELEILLTRLTFCLFADNTGIFEEGLFQKLINETNEDGSDTGGRIGLIFETLDKHDDDRQKTLNKNIAKLRHVNGGLFEQNISTAVFDKEMRLLLLNATTSNWSGISPAIFGNLFQMVMNAEERRKQGAHYTSERDILKIINPLFMDDLQNKFEQIKKRKTTKERDTLLKDLQNKLASMTFFDPACGCGNFLVVAYRELRRLEIDILVLLHTDSDGRRQGKLDAQNLSKIDVHQFYGLELDEFAVHIARAALWMMDHFMNRELSEKIGQAFSRFPLDKSPTIICADALEMDWAELLPPEKCSFIFGNPPFVGAKTQSQLQREQVRKIANLGKTGGTLDYVCAWYIKAGHYIQCETGIGFVATNSITQGEQVAQLWPILFEQCNLEISFAHQTFAWESEAKGKAHVHVVILGLEKQKKAQKNKILFSYEKLKGAPTTKSVTAISPYLFGTNGIGSPRVFVKETSKSLNGLPKMMVGTQPIDDGRLIFNATERDIFISYEPKAVDFMKPFIGGYEFLNSKERYILDLTKASPSVLRKMPTVMKRLQEVREFREKSPRKSTRAIANQPTQFNITAIPKSPFLAIPQTSSERRKYIPIGFLAPPTIPSVKAYFIESATPADLALLSSAMHMAWMRTVTGRIKSDYSYSIGVVYNTFPVPKGANLSKLESYGQAILDARKNHPRETLADLYDPDAMPDDISKAHKANDRAVDRLYSPKPFADDTARINHLFALYEKQTTQ